MNGKKLSKIKFISEIASTHNGSKKEIIQLIKLLDESETDYIKFQIFETDELCHKSSKMYRGLKKVEIFTKTNLQKIHLFMLVLFGTLTGPIKTIVLLC